MNPPIPRPAAPPGPPAPCVVRLTPSQKMAVVRGHADGQARSGDRAPSRQSWQGPTMRKSREEDPEKYGCGDDDGGGGGAKKPLSRRRGGADDEVIELLTLKNGRRPRADAGGGKDEDEEEDTDESESDEDDSSSLASFQLYTPDEERAVVRKLDRRLVVFVALLYMLSFLDRSSACRRFSSSSL